jgi:VWFA-related protein
MSNARLLRHTLLCAAIGSAAVAIVCQPLTASAQSAPALSVKITSPLGRTGTPGTVRIVAQIHHEQDAVLGPVGFFVDGSPVGLDEDGPPYAVPWVDENPFERREIVVRVADTEGRIGEDRIVLDPYEIIEATQVTSVLIEAAVYDRKGRFILDLDASRFSVREDQEPQKIDMVAQEEIPATFALLVDSSQSMSRRMEFVQQAAARVVSYLRSKDRVLVMPFKLELGAVTGPTNDRATVSEAIRAIDAAGGTAISDVLVQAADYLAHVQGRKAIVLITDGYDEKSAAPGERAIEAVKAAGITGYTIGIGGVAGISLKGERFLRQLASTTGGHAFFPPRDIDLVDVYDSLTADAQNRYLITYTPKNQAPDGRWRAISVTSQAGAVVHGRKGYQAPMPPPIRPSLEFTVTDFQRRYVDITRDDLVVLENGVEQKIETFQEAVDPVWVVLAVDASGSMKKSAEAVIEAGRRFLQSIRAEDKLAVITFADKPHLAHAFATTREWSAEALDGYQALGGTALYDALIDSLQYLKTVKGRKAVVVLTDGRDENNPGTAPGSTHSYEDVVQLMRETGVAVYPVGLGTKVDAGRLGQLAELSGGAGYFPTDVQTLDDEYVKIVENLRRRFVLSYTSSNWTRDGTWRTVEIRSRREGVSVASRSGYFAPDR